MNHHHHTTVATTPQRSLLSRFRRTPRTTATVRPKRTSRFGRKHGATAAAHHPVHTSRIGHTNHATTATAGHHHNHNHHHGTKQVVAVPGRRSRFGFRHRPVMVEKRRTTLGDKISGAMTRLKGSLTGRRGVEAAGVRRMHGTDGRVRHY